MKVISVEKKTYSGYVYNLEVEEDHSYVVDGNIKISNCEEGVNSESRFELLQKQLRYCDNCANCEKNCHVLVIKKGIEKEGINKEIADIEREVVIKQLRAYILREKN